MVDIKVTVSDPKTGKSYTKQLSAKETESLFGRDVGAQINGDLIGYAGYSFLITGGSDIAGFPMRRGIPGTGRKAILTREGLGYGGKDRKGRKQYGLRRKKTVSGEKVGVATAQVNLKVVTAGSTPLEAPAQDAPQT